MLIPKVEEEESTEVETETIETTDTSASDEESTIEPIVEPQTETILDNELVIDAHLVRVEEARQIKMNKRQQTAYEKEQRRLTKQKEKEDAQLLKEKLEEANRQYTNDELRLKVEVKQKEREDIRARLIAEREAKKLALDLARRGL